MSEDAGVLLMLEDAGVLLISEDAVVGETTSVGKTGGSPPHTRFCHYRVRHVGAITSGDASFSMQFYPSDAVNAVVGVVSPCSNTVRGRESIMWTMSWRRRCVNEDVDVDLVDVDLCNEVSAVKVQACR
jgi:hypothetical protein